jgi:hypothetical protein
VVLVLFAVTTRGSLGRQPRRHWRVALQDTGTSSVHPKEPMKRLPLSRSRWSDYPSPPALTTSRAGWLCSIERTDGVGRARRLMTVGLLRSRRGTILRAMNDPAATSTDPNAPPASLATIEARQVGRRPSVRESRNLINGWV